MEFDEQLLHVSFLFAKNTRARIETVNVRRYTRDGLSKTNKSRQFLYYPNSPIPDSLRIVNQSKILSLELFAKITLTVIETKGKWHILLLSYSKYLITARLRGNSNDTSQMGPI